MRKKLFVIVDIEDHDTPSRVLKDMDAMAELFYEELESFDDMTLHSVQVFDSLSALNKSNVMYDREIK